jgi:catechol 2,3-dioxygenase-like lactoylglutathione lyase family enzyme
MYLTHISLTMPKGGERLAREFYCGVLGLPELTSLGRARVRDGVWFDVGGLELHLSVVDRCAGPDAVRYFGLGCGDLEGLKAKVQAAGVRIEDEAQAPRKRFFVHDPFGNRIEIHAPRGLLERG